jgi:NYN domain
MVSTDPIRSVLFVDFDNIYSDLGRLNREAAEVFADQPNLWVEWLEAGMGGRTSPRRFLVKNMYLNPAAYGTARAVFTRSGFRAIDCPSLTSQGKSSADIHMVLEIIDALHHETRYDEFVIMSADADFTPVLHRLRAHDRRSVVVTAGPAAAAYRSVADHIVWPNDLVTSALALAPDPSPEDPESSDSERSVTSVANHSAVDASKGKEAAPPSKVTGEKPYDPAPLDDVLRAVRATVAASAYPLWGASAAHAARTVEPRVKELRWYGAGSFRAFVAQHLPELEYRTDPKPGIIRDPLRHAEGATPRKRQELAPVLERVALVTDIPRLDQGTYHSVFRSLVDAVTDNGLTYETSDLVSAAMQAQGKRVTAEEVRRIIAALVAERVQLQFGVTASGMQTVWYQYVVDLCVNAGLQLSEAELRDVETWLSGDSPVA